MVAIVEKRRRGLCKKYKKTRNQEESSNPLSYTGIIYVWWVVLTLSYICVNLQIYLTAFVLTALWRAVEKYGPTGREPRTVATK